MQSLTGSLWAAGVTQLELDGRVCGTVLPVLPS